MPFPRLWCATDLGQYRPCEGTYERYDYDSLPALDPGRFKGDYAWLGDRGDIHARNERRLKLLNDKLSPSGLRLPDDFVTFYRHAALCSALDAASVTGCWTTLDYESNGDDQFSPMPMASPVEAGAFLVRFLNDQQDCCVWYLYLRPSGEVGIVHGYGLEGGEPSSEASAEISWCAASFEEFAYRFWVENQLWRAVRGTATMTPELREYLRHYG